MTTRKVLFVVAVATATVAAFACSSGKKSGSPGSSPTPTPGPRADYTLNGSGFTPAGTYNGSVVGFRILQGTTVLYCNTATTVAGGGFTVTATTALQTGLSYHAEAYVSLDGNATYNSGADLGFYDPAVGTTAGTTFVATSSGRMWAVSKTPTQPITWPSGTTCP